MTKIQLTRKTLNKLDVAKLQQDKEYPNPPIFEVAWELKFVSLPVITESLDLLSTKLETIFPIFGYIYETEPQENKTNYQRNFQNKINGKEFISDRKRNFILRILRNQIVIISRDHKTHEDFNDRISGILKILENIIPTNQMKIQRVGLRYINICELPKNNKNRVYEYINLPLERDRYPIETLDSFRLELSQSFEYHGLQTILYSVMIQDSPRIVVDFDCFKEEDMLSDFTFNDLINQTISLHNVIKQSFENMITQGFIDEVMERNE